MSRPIKSSRSNDSAPRPASGSAEKARSQIRSAQGSRRKARGAKSLFPRHPSQRKIEFVIFATLFVAYAYFNQGGGWNQNSRFDQVRAIAETGCLFMNGYLNYQVIGGSGGAFDLVRRPLPDHFHGRTKLNTGDYSSDREGGRYYPNKPPGTTFLALPAYWLTYQIERHFEIKPNSYWPLTVNLYLTTAFSVGLIGALGGVIFLRLSQRMFPDLPMRAHVASTLTLGLGTMFLPFSTLLFDHVPVAVFLMTAFYFISQGTERSAAGFAWKPVLAGLTAGYAVLCNYPAALGVALLTAYAVWVYRGPKVLLFLGGGLVCAFVLAAYHNACFGGPLVNANTYQNQQFADKSHALLFGMIALPAPDVMVKLLFGSRRGIFFTSPVLLVSLLSFIIMWRRRPVETSLCLAMCLVFWAFNASFLNWHGGYTFAPRYLIPAVPFLALPLALVYARLWWAAAVPAAFSAGVMLLATIVTPLPPESRNNPVWDFLLPIALHQPVNPPDPEASRFVGPVSAWPSGVSAARLPDNSWSCFNIGELVWPQSWMSTLPLFASLAIGIGMALILTRDRSSAHLEAKNGYP